MIDRYTISRIIDAADIVDVVSSYVKLTKKGANFWAPCPFHNEKTGSFSVSPSKNIYKCFGCGKGGNVVNFVMEIEHLSYPEALRVLAKKYNIEVPDRELTDEEKSAEREREALFNANEFAEKFFEEQLKQGEGAIVGLSYFRERGFTDEVIKEFHLGYWPENRTALLDAVKASGYNTDVYVEAGLLSKDEKTGQLTDKFPFNGRVVFPWKSASGKFLAFTARKLTRDTKGVEQKYVNSKGNPIFQKSEEIFGIYQAQNEIRVTENVYMVEGQADVISLHQCGIKNVVACSGGNGLSEVQARKLKKMANVITLMYDSDDAGIKYTNGAIEQALNFGFNIYVVSLPDGKDPDEMAREYNASDLIALINNIKIDWVTYHCNKFKQEGNSNDVYSLDDFLTTTMMPLFAKIGDEMIRRRLVHHCAHMLQVASVEEELYLNKIERFRREEYRRKKELEEKQAAEKENPNVDQGEAPPPPIENFGPEQQDGIPPVQKQPQGKPIVSKADERFVKLEKQILSYVLRYGDLSYSDENGEHKLLEFVVAQLALTDNIQFRKPLYQSMFAEIVEHYADDDFHDAEYYFVHHPNPEYAAEVANLVSDVYQKSNIFTDEAEKLPEDSQRRIKYEQKKQEEERHIVFVDISKLIINYKLEIIKEEEQKLLSDMELPIDEKITKLKQISEMKKACAKQLDRVMF